jgi:hypothetical protein
MHHSKEKGRLKNKVMASVVSLLFLSVAAMGMDFSGSNDDDDNILDAGALLGAAPPAQS